MIAQGLGNDCPVAVHRMPKLWAYGKNNALGALFSMMSIRLAIR